MTKKTFLAVKYRLTALLLLAFLAGAKAQTGTYKNTTGASGTASVGATPVSDIASATFQFPAIGVAVAAGAPDLQPDGSYNITYTYTIQNLGGIALTQVQTVADLSATFPAPMAFTIKSVSANGVTANGSFTGTGGNTSLLTGTNTLAAGSTATVTVIVNLKNNGQYGTFNTQATATGNAGGSVVSDISVNGLEPDANHNGTASDDNSPTPVKIERPDIQITKTVSNLTPYVGTTVVFTITATNIGAGDAIGVTVPEAPGDGFTIQSANVPGGTSYDNTVWTIGKLKAGEQRVLTITAFVKASGNFSNTASCNIPEDINTGNNSATVTLTPKPAADAQITKTVDNPKPNVGDVVTYTLTAKNAGLSDATGVVVTDKMPAGLEPSGTLPSGVIYDPGLRQYTWNIGNMAASTTLTQTLATTVTADIDRSNFTNTATINANEDDPAPGNNVATVTIVPKEKVDLGVTKQIVTTTNPIYPGDPATFIIKVRNYGPNNCYDANVTDVLPNGYTNWNATPGKGTFDAVTGLWKIGTLLKDEEVTLTLTANFKPTGSYGNTASIITTDNDTNPANDVATVPPPTVKPRTDLQVTIVPTGTPDVGNNLTFNINIKNNGPSDATGVTVENLQLPNGYTLVSKDKASYDPVTGIWTIGNLTAGSTIMLKIVATLLPDANYNFGAHVYGVEDETTLTNNNANTSVVVAQVADLSVNKTIDNATPEVGSTVNFTITVTNNGPSKATNVKVTDAIPNGYTMTTIFPSAGTYSAGVWNVGLMSKGQTETLKLTVTVNPIGNYTNTATVTATEKDKVPGNNTSSVTPTVSNLVDLGVTKTVNNPTPDAGSTVVFTIKVNNTGFNQATNVVVTDLLPDGYQFISATPSKGAYDAVTGQWKMPLLPVAAPETLTITAKVKPTGNYSNTVTAKADERDTYLPNNTATVTPTVRQITDLAITKQVDKSVADAGSDVKFTLTVTNKGVSDATNVKVNDLLPSGFTFKAASLATYSNGVWTIGNMPANSSLQLDITATVNPEGDYTNTATVAGDEYDPQPNNNSGSATVTRTPVTDLEVVKSVSNNTPDAGETITFTIKAINHGPSKATGVKVTDVLPDGYTFVSSTPGQGTFNSGSGIWNIGAMDANAIVNMTISATVKATGNYSNTATISGTEADRNPANNSSTVTPVLVPMANLKVTKTISNDKPDAGSSVTFTITATNNGPSAATGVTVTDILKNGYQFTAKTTTAGTYDETTGIWTIGNMANADVQTLTITAKVLPTGDYNNTATISSPVKDNDNSDNTATIPPPQVRPVTDLVVLKTVDKTTADAASNVTFTLTATNNGPSTATNVVVTDLLPTGFSFVSATPAAGYDNVSGQWNIGTMNSGTSQTLQITATVNPEGNYTNTATIAGTEYDPNLTNNQQDATVTRVAVSDLEVTKTVDNSTPDVGEIVTFTIQATNHGPSKATGVIVTDVLPAGYALVNSNTATGTYTAGSWNIGMLTQNATATLTIQATVLASGSYSNTATIAGNEVDRVPTNNTSTVTPTPTPVANLSVVKTISNSTPDVSSQVTFTITASNNGPSNATGVTVTDILQSGYHFDLAIPSAGTYDNASGKWTIGNLANGQSATLQIKATVLPSGDYNNKAIIKGNEKDKTPADDESAITPPIPVPVADLQVNKTVSTLVPGTGDPVTFTITVKNNGASNATNVQVTDVIQSGFSFQQATTAKGNYNSSTGLWTIGNMNAGETVTLKIDALVNTTGNYTNTATVKGNEKDPDASNNSSTVTITPDPVADLKVTKTVSNMAPPHGSDVTFTIVAGNNGPSDATGITVTDILPAGYTFKSANASTGNYSATTGSWTIGQLANQATAQLTITATVNKTGSYANTATIRGNETDRVATNNSSTVTPVPVPLHTNDDAASTEEPEPVTINVIKNDIYGNTGHTVYIKDLPKHGTVKDNQDGTVTYTPEPGFGGTDQFTYYIQDQSGFMSNVSTVTVDVTKRLVDLAIKKVLVTPQAEIAVGKNIVFELTVTNNSRKGASRVVVTDILAQNIGDTEIKTETATGKASYEPVSKTMTWKLDSLAPQQTAKLLVTAKLISGGKVENTATVAGANDDPDMTNNTATAGSDIKGADIFVPTAFTPNGDGINDKFIILGIDKYPGSSLVIFNRWGNVVYRSNDYRNEWDGSQLHEGTYYYELVCPTSNGKVSLKGWVQLVR
ncbi:DUF7507 domain-containing protein [Chitinophaga flava]|uniref:DUF11 domain-containing protein n=1 Tax=Chitinophaga flava TaxID=2259036 RepID=A0A365XYD5_9BACT|nr:gliding motility-associated C-terminal domain-containing protein [Chitinophaga flava]RBL91240.1 hypothetical protein DF182_01035 [Chitinophaga flava]